MLKYLNYLFILIWLGYLLSAGVYLFSKGFLLSRISQPHRSNCHKFSELKCHAENCSPHAIASQILNNVNASADVCLPKKSRVIFLMIDALKYDFGVYNADNLNPLPYENKMPIFHELMNRYPERSRLLRFIADPPTTTMQRLKGLTTGSLPTFIDVGSNFATPEINEDNIIDQVVQNNLTAVFMGDGTWTELFPKRFRREYGYPSFNIYDLDTIDSKIKSILPKEMKEADWDLLIAHFLGVDHCGHKHGPVHSEMTRKLDEMNGVIAQIVHNMDDDTILVVAGDHGMTMTGDHGGDSKDEIEALFFMYSKGKDLYSEEFALNRNSMQQIDIVPTLAAILGVPIPYSNLGTIQYSLLPEVNLIGFEPYQIMLVHGWSNLMQVYRYFQVYSSQNGEAFQTESMENIEKQFIVLSHRANTIYTKNAFKNFSNDLNYFMNNLLTNCRNLWINFNSNYMSKGLLIVFTTIFAIFLLNNLGMTKLEKTFTKSYVAVIFLSNLVGYPVGYFLRIFSIIDICYSDILFYSSIYSFAIIILVVIQNWDDIAERWHGYKTVASKFLRVVYIMFIIVFFSNSFIVQEQKVLNYLIVGILIISLYELNNNLNRDQRDKRKFLWMFAIAVLVALIILRISYMLFKCREEQGNCYISYAETNSKFQVKSPKKDTTIGDFIPVIIMALFTSVTKYYMKNIGNLSGFLPHVIFYRYAPTLATICISGHFLLSNNKILGIPAIHIDGLAWVIYALVFIQIVILLINPLLVFVLPPKDKNPIPNLSQSENVVPELFRHIKNRKNAEKTDQQQQTDKSYDIPIVYGLATVYSSVIIAVGVMLALLFALLLGHNPSMGIFVSIFVAVTICLIGGMLKGRNSQTIEDYLQPQLITLVAYTLLIHYTFYATSHQPTLSQIDWHAAFVGRSKYNDNIIISGFLIILNTFNSQLLFLIIYPILVLLPIITSLFLLPTSAPTTAAANKIKERNVITLADGAEIDLTRGELNLFEYENYFFGAIFKTGLQLIMLQGARIFCSMLACTIHCRHLMVWKIFAPRFIYEGIATYITVIAIIIGYLFVLRIHKAVETLILNINKKIF